VRVPSSLSMMRRPVWAALAACVLALALLPAPALVGSSADTLPQRLTDAEFWKMSEEFSEPNGYFRSDNLLSNEIYYPYIMNDLLKRTAQGGSVYLGVGPEQNFNYIALLKPKMVFITDVRRGNLHTQLMYKALFELSADRADFLSRLFTKKRPAGLTAASSAADLLNAYWNAPTSTDGNNAAYRENLKAIQDHLTKKRSLPLGDEDLKGIEYVYYNFYWFGPSITYNSSSATGGGRGGGSMANYADLMMATDGTPAGRSYLASEETFKVLKDLEERNLIVPVVGNFAGPKALRAEGRYLKERGATVMAFYLSNVEQYLQQDGIWNNFCANVASLPLDEKSTFIRSSQGGGGGGGGGLVNSLGSMLQETRGCGRPAPASVRMPR
jgi:hypothetical protein